MTSNRFMTIILLADYRRVTRWSVFYRCYECR